MSDLGAIFHVKKNGVQYDAHAYTTTDECPEPNLKIKFRGQQAYVKMEQGKGNGDVPCYVKDKDGVVYQVRKEATPTGSMTVQYRQNVTFVVPSGIKIIKVSFPSLSNAKPYYIGVTSNSTHYLIWKIDGKRYKLHCSTHNVDWQPYLYGHSLLLSWSPEINKNTPNITDYS